MSDTGRVRENGFQPPPAVVKAATGVAGLDTILEGGVPEGGLTLLSGGPGSGKTILALEFLVRGALAGRRGVMVTFEEQEVALRRYGQAFGWDIEKLEAEGQLALIGARLDTNAVLSGEFDLGGVLAILRHKCEALGATQVVVDAPDVFLRLLANKARERIEFYRLHDFLREHGMTALMTVKMMSGPEGGSYYDFLDYLADCVIVLDQRVREQVTTRRLRIMKYRGSAYGRNEYPFCVTTSGTWIIPVTQTSLQHHALGEAVSSGIAGLDQLLGGGYRRCSCTLIAGTSGTGKTTFAASFTRSATAAGARVLYLDFEESWDALASCMLGPGIDLSPAMASGRLRFISSMPESQGIEEHLIVAFRSIEHFKPAFLVLDAISACRRMGSEHAAFDYLIRLVDHCKIQGITCLLTNLTNNAEEETEITGMDLSSVIDTVILLRNLEAQGCYKRFLTILKSRGQRHSAQVHGFRITDAGIEIAGFSGGEEA